MKNQKAKKNRPKGFCHVFSYQQLVDYRQLSARSKLNWLEEANRFCAAAIHGKTRRIWEMFRAGKI